MIDVRRYGEKEVEKALNQMERRRGYQRKYYQSAGGRLAQKRSQVRSVLRMSGFSETEIETIVARIRLPEDDGYQAGAGGAKGGGVE